MSGVESGPIVVSLPEPTGRRLRLGPFPSAREALKFVTYAAVGGVVAGLVGPLAWFPFLGSGFLFAVYRPEGRGLDRRFHDYCRWRMRSRDGGPSPPEAVVRGGAVRVEGGRFMAVLAAQGIPVAFLPPRDARRRFEQYRLLLRSLDERLFLRVGVEPLSPRPFLGASARGPVPGGTDARAGYRELVQLLCRRRSVRRVDVYLVGCGEAATHLARLEAQVAAVERSLGEMGVGVRRLRERELEAAVRRSGFRPGPGGST